MKHGITLVMDILRDEKRRSQFSYTAFAVALAAVVVESFFVKRKG